MADAFPVVYRYIEIWEETLAMVELIQVATSSTYNYTCAEYREICAHWLSLHAEAQISFLLYYLLLFVERLGVAREPVRSPCKI